MPTAAEPPIEIPATTPAPPKSRLAWLALALFLSLCFISWFGTLGELAVAIGAEPIRLQLQGLASPDQIVVTCLTTVKDPDNDAREFGSAIPRESLMFPSQGRAEWRTAGHWIKTLHITAPEAVLESLTGLDIEIGTRPTHYTAQALATWPRVPLAFTGLLPDRSQPAITVELPFQNEAINAPAVPELARRILVFPMIAFPAALAAAWLLARVAPMSKVRNFWNALQHHAQPQTESTLWCWAGAALAAAGLALLYARYSYPFTQDDNFSQFLPMVLFNCRSLLEGHWPAWNPHQFMGMPDATIGIYSVTYPPLYLAYGIARALGQENWTIEIYTLLHLGAGYALLHALLRRMRVRPSLAALAAASFVLSGWFLIAGRSQMTFAPLAVWPVAMAWSLHALPSGVTWKWTSLTGLSIGLFFHAGHSQMWVYALLFYGAGIGIELLAGRLRWRAALAALPALLIGLGIAAPLLILQFIEGTSSARTGAYGDRIDLLHMLLPLGSLWPREATLGGFGHEYFPEMYYSGTLFQLLTFTAIALAVTNFILKPASLNAFRGWLGANTWVALFALAVLFGLGNRGILWTIFSGLPLFDRFRWPIKFEYYCLLYSTIAGAILADRLFTKWPRLQYPLIAACAGLLLFHVNLCRTSWYDFAERPYPKATSTIDSSARVLTRWESMYRSPLPALYGTLSLNFATHAGAYAIGGYDTFVEGTLANRRARHRFWTDPVAAARAYGVKWVLTDSLLDNPKPSSNRTFWPLETASIGNILAIHRAQDAGRKLNSALYKLDGADPLAFLEPGHIPLPIQMNSEGATIATPSTTGSVTANLLMRPWLTAIDASGRPLTIEADDWGRARIALPHPTPGIQVKYSPPWKWTLLCGLLLTALGTLLFLGLRNLPDSRIAPRY